MDISSIENKLESLLFVDETYGTGPDLKLPPADANIFHRIVKNPNPASRAPRELACSQMLCAVLQNSPVLRSSIFLLLSKLAGCDIDDFKQLSYSFETEQKTVGQKRDDLRIRGWKEEDGEPQTAFLWTFEIKVNAPFSRSRTISTPDSDSDDGEKLNQVKFYDDWLQGQNVPNKAGFVVSIRGMRNKLPEGLKCSWTTLLWADLARIAESVLRHRENESTLPQDERFLVRHFLGFIRQYLSRVSDMSNSNSALTFNDIAFLRAVSRFGSDCEKKIKVLTEKFEVLLAEAAIAKGPMTKQISAYKAFPAGAAFSKRLFARGQDTDPHVSIGIFGTANYECPSVEICIEYMSPLDRTVVFRRGIKGVMKVLERSDRRWLYEGSDGEDEGKYCDIICSMPLTDILELESGEQVKVVEQFVQKSLATLKSAKVVELLQRASVEVKRAK